MKCPLILLMLCSLLPACSFPEANIWHENPGAKTVALPAKIIDRVIIRGSAVSIYRNPFTSTHKGFSMTRARGEIIADPLLSLIPDLDPVYRYAHSIDDALDRIGMPAPVPGTVEYLIDGEDFFGDVLTEIEDAERRIDTRVFIFDNDDVAVDFADVLKRKAEKVRCRILLDEMGSIAAWSAAPATGDLKPADFQSDMVKYLKQDSRIQVRKSLNPWLVADHSKLITIDEKLAYLGGMNIGREYRYEWHDMMIKVTGPVVKALQNDFNRAWRLQGVWGDWSMPFYYEKAYRKEKQPGEIDIRVLKTSASRRDIERSILTAIRMSRKRVYLQNSYFTSRELERELIAARRRGVDVRMVFPEDNDSKLLKSKNQTVAKNLVEAGVKVYMYQPFTHVKAVVVDDWACVGSANFDALSFRINEELNIAFSDRAAVQKLVRDLFVKDFGKSVILTRGDVKTWGPKPIDLVADQL
ncbi:phosphatidylserine/phosphatidylglycerophosphate/cardiolipin synthase family protein [Verrucomicrobiaceae bacterium R5-34]|nr:phosphatidylserine/phosphatidylglycerophosphate/cardiolipin synthase family protein [Verrucomicrobiaceae bacterium R5-34]